MIDVTGGILLALLIIVLIPIAFVVLMSISTMVAILGACALLLYFVMGMTVPDLAYGGIISIETGRALQYLVVGYIIVLWIKFLIED